jgi:hypothetical protein
MGKQKQAQTIAGAIYSDKMLAGEGREALLHAEKKHYRKNVLPSQTVLEHMDNYVGVFNSAGVELARTVEKASLPASKHMKFYRAILPSKAAISIAARKFELAAANIIPFETFSTTSGEGVKFTNLPNVIQTILRAHGLHKTAKRRQVEFGVSINAVPITKTLSHVIMTLTLIDAGAMDPRSKVPFFLQDKS